MPEPLFGFFPGAQRRRCRHRTGRSVKAPSMALCADCRAFLHHGTFPGNQEFSHSPLEPVVTSKVIFSV